MDNEHTSFSDISNESDESDETSPVVDDQHPIASSKTGVTTALLLLPPPPSLSTTAVNSSRSAIVQVTAADDHRTQVTTLPVKKEYQHRSFSRLDHSNNRNSKDHRQFSVASPEFDSGHCSRDSDHHYKGRRQPYFSKGHSSSSSSLSSRSANGNTFRPMVSRSRRLYQWHRERSSCALPPPTFIPSSEDSNKNRKLLPLRTESSHVVQEKKTDSSSSSTEWKRTNFFSPYSIQKKKKKPQQQRLESCDNATLTGKKGELSSKEEKRFDSSNNDWGNNDDGRRKPSPFSLHHNKECTTATNLGKLVVENRTNLPPKRTSSPRYVDEIVDRRTTSPKILCFVSKNLMTFSTGSVFILCIRDNGFTLTNGFASHCEDACSDIYKSLKYVLLSLEVGQVICTDHLTHYLLKATIDTATQNHILHNVNYLILRDFEYDIGVCHECDKECHRFRAIIATSKYLKFSVKFIPHCVVVENK